MMKSIDEKTRVWLPMTAIVALVCMAAGTLWQTTQTVAVMEATVAATSARHEYELRELRLDLRRLDGRFQDLSEELSKLTEQVRMLREKK